MTDATNEAPEQNASPEANQTRLAAVKAEKSALEQGMATGDSRMVADMEAMHTKMVAEATLLHELDVSEEAQMRQGFEQGDVIIEKVLEEEKEEMLKNAAEIRTDP